MFLFLPAGFFLNYFLQAGCAEAIIILLFYNRGNVRRNLHRITLAIHNIAGIAFKGCPACFAGFHSPQITCFSFVVRHSSFVIGRLSLVCGRSSSSFFH